MHHDVWCLDGRPAAARRIASTRERLRTSLSTYPLAPASTAERRASSSSYAVRMRQKTTGRAERMSQQRSIPFPSGRRHRRARQRRAGRRYPPVAVDHGPRFADHLEIRLGIHQLSYPAAHDLVVVHQEHADHGSAHQSGGAGTRHSIRVDTPVRDAHEDPATIRSAARSARLASPLRGAESGIPGRHPPRRE